MKKLTLFFIVSLFFVSCGTPPLTDEEKIELRNREADSTMASLRSPVVLIGATKYSDGDVSITVKDGFGKVVSFSQEVRISTNIGGSRNVKDTIR